MNILLDTLPNSFNIDSNDYKIRSDFRTWIKIENLLFWDNSSLHERIMKCLLLCFISKIPSDINEAIAKMLEFYQCNGSEKFPSVESKETNETSSKTPIQNRIYSFAYDASLIYAAFRSQYGINLCMDKLHWWEFNSLFTSLEDTNKICKIMEYRSMDLSRIKDKEQKAFYCRMKQIYKLPDPRSEEEKEADMIDAFAQLF